MKLIGVISTAVLSLTLGVAAPVYAQQEEEKSKPSQQEEKKTQPDKSARQAEKGAPRQDKNARQEERNAQQHTQQAKPERQEQRAGGNGGGRIPDDRFRANFGQEHKFRVSQGDYRDHRFQYGGYSFGFVDPWPSNWLYTQDVFVVEINGVYYLCNPMYPGVNIALSFTL
jgi:phage repressor protein C with HTH and peptisase S24 domain